jgi:hypothetical protein
MRDLLRAGGRRGGVAGRPGVPAPGRATRHAASLAAGGGRAGCRGGRVVLAGFHASGSMAGAATATAVTAAPRGRSHWVWWRPEVPPPNLCGRRCRSARRRGAAWCWSWALACHGVEGQRPRRHRLGAPNLTSPTDSAARVTGVGARREVQRGLPSPKAAAWSARSTAAAAPAPCPAALHTRGHHAQPGQRVTLPGGPRPAADPGPRA